MSASRRRGSPPRILPVMTAVSGGGIQRANCSLLRLLSEKRRRGIVDYRALSLFGPDNDAHRQELCERVGARLRHFAGRRGAFSRSVLWHAATWADLVMFMHVGVASLLPLLPRWLRPRSMTFIYGIDVWFPLPLRKRWALKCSDQILAISEFTDRKARQSNPWLPRAQCCHLGIPPEPAPQPVDLDAELGFSPGPHDVLIVGRVVKDAREKGHQQLIAAMEEVVSRVPDARLIIAGTGDDVEYYRRQAGRTPVADHVIFTGFMQDEALWELYRRCGVFAMPSRQEGFGLVYLEAMRAGVPCVASNCDAAQEVVVDGQTGYTVDPDDREALVGALTRLLLDPDLRRRLGVQGKARFEAYFTEEHFHERLWQALRGMLPVGSA